MLQLTSAVGLFFMLLLAWAMSNNRRVIPWRVVISGLALQLLFALLILKSQAGAAVFVIAKDVVNTVIGLSDEGAKFVFGPNFTDHFFAFKVLPTIIFVSSISYLLFYWGFLQKVVSGLAWIMHRSMGISGAESLCAAANVFVGQTEAPLLIKPYLNTMTRSEIMCMMTSGMATVAGGVLAAYVGFGISAGHLLAASVMSAPAAIVIAKLMYPETEVSPTAGHVKVTLPIDDVNAFEAACKGASEGLKLSLNVAAMLIAFIALVKLGNEILAFVTFTVPAYFNVGWAEPGATPFTIQDILGYVFTPFAFLMGIPWEDCFKVGVLLGERTVVNEFLAFLHLGEAQAAGALSPRAITITTYALCGFANFSSIAIQIGGIGALAPERRKDFAIVGLRSMIGGTLAAFMTACIAGFLIE